MRLTWECFRRGHPWHTWMYEGGRMYAPPCPLCGKPNPELRWAHRWREIHTTPPPDPASPDGRQREPTDEEWAAYAAESREWAEATFSAGAETWVDPSDDDIFCHCGELIAFGFDGDPAHHRGMCGHCDSVRCDAYPGECGR